MTSRVETNEMWLIARHHPDDATRIEAGMRAISALGENELMQVVVDSGLPFQVRFAAARQLVTDLVNKEDHVKLEHIAGMVDEDLIVQLARNSLRDLALIDGYYLMESEFGMDEQLAAEETDSVVRLSRIIANHPEKAYRKIAARVLTEFCKERGGEIAQETALVLIKIAEESRITIELRVECGRCAVRYYVSEGGKNEVLNIIGQNMKLPDEIRSEANDQKNRERADMNYLMNIDFMLDSEQLSPDEAGFMYLQFNERQETTAKGRTEAMKRFQALRPWVRERASRELEQEKAAMAIMRSSVVEDDAASLISILTEYVRCCVGRNRQIGKFFRALADERVPAELKDRAADIAKRTAIAAAERYGLGMAGMHEPNIEPKRRIWDANENNRHVLRRIRPAGHA